MKEFKFIIDGHNYQTSVNELSSNLAEVTVNGTTFKVEIEKNEPQSVPRQKVTQVVSAAQSGAQTQSAGVKVVKSPLPGSIIKVNVKVGDKVNAGDELLTMESMKMENSIKSEYAGTVKAVYAEPGKNVMQEDRLVEIETIASAPQAAPKVAPQPTVVKGAAPAQPTPQAAAPSQPTTGTKVTSPLPGSVVKVLVLEGQAIKRGDTLLILESMKMENAINAEQDGIVKQIAVTAGQNVMQEDLLVVLG